MNRPFFPDQILLLKRFNLIGEWSNFLAVCQLKPALQPARLSLPLSLAVTDKR
jgi:hypothetical protein